jgi:hypothetical protein
MSNWVHRSTKSSDDEEIDEMKLWHWWWNSGFILTMKRCVSSSERFAPSMPTVGETRKPSIFRRARDFGDDGYAHALVIRWYARTRIPSLMKWCKCLTLERWPCCLVSSSFDIPFPQSQRRRKKVLGRVINKRMKTKTKRTKFSGGDMDILILSSLDKRAQRQEAHWIDRGFCRFEIQSCQKSRVNCILESGTNYSGKKLDLASLLGALISKEI